MFLLKENLMGFSLGYNKIIPPIESQSNLYGELKLSIKKFPYGKLSAIFVSEITERPCFQIKFIFKWAKTNLSEFQVQILFLSLSEKLD